MQLINAGFGRTGTTSLKAALEQLGFKPIYHSTDMLTSPKDLDVWEAAIRGEAVDWPAGLFYREIIEVTVTVHDAFGKEEYRADSDCHLGHLKRNNSNSKIDSCSMLPAAQPRSADLGGIDRSPQSAH